MLIPRHLARTFIHNTRQKSTIRTFHQTAVNMVKVGDPIPNVDLVEGSPSDKVNLSKELASGKGVIVGVPAAFSEFVLNPTKHPNQNLFKNGSKALTGSSTLLDFTRPFLLGHPCPRLRQ